MNRDELIAVARKETQDPYFACGSGPAEVRDVVCVYIYCLTTAAVFDAFIDRENCVPFQGGMFERGTFDVLPTREPNAHDLSFVKTARQFHSRETKNEPAKILDAVLIILPAAENGQDIFIILEPNSGHVIFMKKDIPRSRPISECRSER